MDLTLKLLWAVAPYGWVPGPRPPCLPARPARAPSAVAGVLRQGSLRLPPVGVAAVVKPLLPLRALLCSAERPRLRSRQWVGVLSAEGVGRLCQRPL